MLHNDGKMGNVHTGDGVQINVGNIQAGGGVVVGGSVSRREGHILGGLAHKAAVPYACLIALLIEIENDIAARTLALEAHSSEQESGELLAYRNLHARLATTLGLGEWEQRNRINNTVYRHLVSRAVRAQDAEEEQLWNDDAAENGS
jgi:hypothetical protein